MMVKQIAYADDVSFLIHNTMEINETLKEFQRYGKLSGTALNTNKTEILQLGNHTPHTIEQQNQKYIQTNVKILGITFSRTDLYDPNNSKIINKMKQITNWWKTRQLTLNIILMITLVQHN